MAQVKPAAPCWNEHADRSSLLKGSVRSHRPGCDSLLSGGNE